MWRCAQLLGNTEGIDLLLDPWQIGDEDPVGKGACHGWRVVIGMICLAALP